MNIAAILLSVCIAVSSMPTTKADLEEQGFVKLKTTAYCMGTTTASGTPVRPGVVATDKTHRGMMCEIYLVDEETGLLGEYLGLYSCEDAGGTDAIKEGRVIDVYRKTYQQCKSYMKLTKGRCWVRYIEGEG